MNFSPLTKFWLPVFCALASAAGSLSAATEGSVSPLTIASNSTGDVTIAVTGLVAAGDTVRVERILDLNSNGAADAGEPLVQSFLVTDGQVTSFGGVRNPNIPGDDDGASDGKITTNISLIAASESGRTAGSHVIRISSPTNTFATITKTLAVTQPGYGQSVSGQVTSGGSAVANAVVTALQGGGDYVASVVSDVSGNYTLNLPAGGYALAATKPDYVASMSTAPMFALAANQTLTGQDPALTAATCWISGKTKDISGTPTLKGVQLTAMSTGGGVAITSSDSDGNYVLPSLPGQWRISTSDGSMNTLGYLKPDTDPTATTTTGNTTALDLSFTPATSMVYGTVKTPAGAAMPGVRVESYDQPDMGDGLYSANVKTDADGKYFLGMTGTTSWSVEVNSQAALAPYIMPDIQWIHPSPNAAILVDFSAIQVTAHFQGTVTRNGTPVPGLGITADVSNNETSVSTTTDADGHFNLGVVAGTWWIGLDDETLIYASLPPVTVSNGQTVEGQNITVLDPTGTISGNLYDPYGAPLATDEDVYAYTDSGTYYEVYVEPGPDGSFSLPVLAGIEWWVGSDGCGDDQAVTPQPDASVTIIQSAITEDPNDQTVPVGGNATFSVTVNAPGTPTIQWQQLPNGADWNTGWADITDNSTYSGATTPSLTVNNTTGAMTGDQFRCVVSYLFNESPKVNTSDSARLQVVSAHLLGQVTKDGTGVSGLWVNASCNNAWTGTTTGADGSFDLGVSGDGTWYVNVDSNYVTANNLVAPSYQAVVINSQNVPNIPIQLVAATGTISGSVKDAGGNPLTQTFVWAFATINEVSYNANAQTDASGNYSFPVIDGTWNVGVGGPVNFPQQSVPVNGNATVNFAPPAVVAHAFGTVTKNGSPFAGALVWASQGQLWASATSGPDGSFDLGLTATGYWSISLESNYANANSLVRTMHWVEVNGNVSGLEIKIADGTGTISGSVKDASNAPLTNVGVHAFAMVGGTQFYAYANTNGSGIYSLPTINGTWDVSVLWPAFNTRTVTVTTSAQVDFTPATSHFQGTMTKNSVAVANMVILAVPQDVGNQGIIATTITDANGGFDLGVTAGTWAIRIAQGWANPNNLVGPSIYKTVDSTPTTIPNIAYEVLDGNATIWGSVKDSGNNPVAGTNIWASTLINGVEYNGSAHTDANGNYSFPSLNGYTWTVAATGLGYPSKQVIVSGATEVNFASNPFATWQADKFTADEIATGRTTPTADFEGDGMPNLLEYAFGKNPTVADVAGIVPAVSVNKMRISFPRDPACTDITYTVQASPNLSTWEDIAQSVGGAATAAFNNSGCEISDAGTGPRTVTVTEKDAFAGKRFLRVKVTTP